MSAHLGLDIGGTACRWVLCDDFGRELGRGKAPGATGHLFNPVERERLASTLSTVARAIGPTSVVSVTAGLTGFGAAVRPDAQSLLAKTFGADPNRVIVIDDIVLAYMANFAPGEGHLISAGTGSIGIHIATDGTVYRVGGRGILIDDAGSGSWIALWALDLIYRAFDKEGSFRSVDRLAHHLFAQIGGQDWSDVRQFVYGSDRGRIGSLSLAVARAAEDNDEVALAILREAGTELAKLAGALIGRAGDRPVGLVGGVLALHDVVLKEVQLLLGASTTTVLSGDAPLAAARLQALNPDNWQESIGRLRDATR